MGEAAGGPIDLLRRFGGAVGETTSAAEDGDDAREIELSLGLSLGGWYSGGEKRGRLVRASSIASIAPAAEGEGERERPLMRTCSMPAETEEVRKKGKQMLRRMEAKRKRLERREMRTILGRERTAEVEFRWGRSDAALGSTGVWKRQGGPAAAGAKALSGSQGSSSGSGSGADLYCASIQALDISANAINSDENSSYHLHSSACNVIDQRKTPASPYATTMVGNSANSTSEEIGSPSKEPPPTVDRSRQVARIMMEQMPCVSTRAHGPNGKRIEGFLYKYGKGEEVRIVCVCHGDFLTPAEFVKHAGGGDVDHPLRHIVVNPSPLTL